MKKKDRLQVMLCVPGRDYPGEKVIVAKVKDNKETRLFTFGSDWAIRHINQQIPRLWLDFRSKRRKKVG
ncbi:hypothetical protein WD019_18995 [Fictibacillus sp. Mic-4]|uniref:hypothetical protein n=1 Tax=Fictibacillus sp. Mic-4 TaxID=3132826 RepID=UPI003CF2B3D6